MNKLMRLFLVIIILIINSFPLAVFADDDITFMETYNQHGASNIYITEKDKFNYTLFCEKEQKKATANQNTKICPFCDEDVEPLTKNMQKQAVATLNFVDNNINSYVSIIEKSTKSLNTFNIVLNIILVVFSGIFLIAIIIGLIKFVTFTFFCFEKRKKD